MKYFCLLSVLLLSQFTMGQITKTYITKDCIYSVNPKTASVYILIQKLADTAYLLKEFGMNDTIIMRGTYKDSLLNVKNGKFYYYNKLRSTAHTIFPDTNNYIQRAGYYSNNTPIGIWREYEANGKISKEYNFENGKLNGPYKEFYDDYSGKWSEVNVVNDEYEGTHKTYTADSILIEETEYLHNKIINKKLHLSEAIPFDNFYKYLESRLKKYEPELKKSQSFVQVTVDKTGHLHNPQVMPSINSEIDSAINTILVKAPIFYPSKYDDQPIEQRLFYPLILFRDAENKAFTNTLEQDLNHKHN
jgi:antitoxin component YwqK of YwqJK toxin-antitoxin module